MAKLPPFEVRAIWAKDELNKGKANREKALRFLAEAGDGPLARELRASINKRGRQPFGAKHRWWDIGTENDDLTAQGMGYEDRVAELGARFMLHPRQIEEAIAKYGNAAEEIRAIDQSIQDH